MRTKFDIIMDMMPTLKHYSFRLLLFICHTDPVGDGVVLKQSYIMQKTGLCQRSLQLAIQELEEMGILERDGNYAPIFIIHL